MKKVAVVTDGGIQDVTLFQLIKFFSLFHDIVIVYFDIIFRFTLPPNLTLKNFEDLDLGKMEKVKIVIFQLEFS